MAHLYESQAILPQPDRLHDAVDAVARQPEDEADAVLDQRIDENFRRLAHEPTTVPPFGCNTWPVM